MQVKKIYLLSILLFGLFNVNSQTQITLTFMGMDSVSQNPVLLDSVYVQNLTEDCDTLLYGPDPVLSLLANWPVGLHEISADNPEAFILKQNYPNPFQGSTIVGIYREYQGPLNLMLFDVSGTKLAEYHNDFEKGFHSFTISSSGNKILILNVFDNRNGRSIKIISALQGNDHNAIQYLGHAGDVEKGHLKSNDKSGFIFYLGNQMKYTAHATGFNEQTIIDDPLTDSTYIFNMSMIINLAEVTTATVTDITQTTAISGGEVTSDGGGPVTARGVCWSIMPGPTTVNDHTTDGNGTGSFISNLTWLNPNTTYYIRAYATNSTGTAYGNELTFTTLVAELPAVTTTPATNITQTTATSGGNVTSDGGDFVFARGVCWSISPEPTISGDHTLDGGGIGNFESYLSGLIPNTPYYIRAYATNSAGTAYGDELTFTTLSATTPTVTTTPVTDITSTTATSGGDVTSDGGAPVTERGVCWSLLPNPTTTDSHTSDGSGTGTFVSYLTGLTQDTLYYVRAYATNTVGTAYGDNESFTTSSLFVIGQSYGGGIIFWIDGTGQHGLIAAASDQSSGAQWGCSGTLIGGTSTAIGTGQANTTAIVNGCSTAGIAARICDNLVLNGYSDWFLPSKDELNQMYIQKTIIGGFTTSLYWSSSEANAYGAWAQVFDIGSWFNPDKFEFYNVRAVRAF